MSFDFRSLSRGIDITKKELFSKRTRSIFPKAGTLAKITKFPKKGYLTKSSIRIKKLDKSSIMNTFSRRHTTKNLDSSQRKRYITEKKVTNPLEKRLFDTYIKYNHDVVLEKINYFTELKHDLDLNFEMVKNKEDKSDEKGGVFNGMESLVSTILIVIKCLLFKERLH